MNIQVIYQLMNERGLAPSARTFSRDWLGKSYNYSCLLKGKEVPPAALVHLWQRLSEAAHHDLAAKVLLLLLGEWAMSDMPDAPAHSSRH